MNKVTLEKNEITPSKVVCVGKNYPLHIEEMGGKSKTSEPVIFIKPNSAICSNPQNIFVSDDFGELHYEVELCFLIGKQCKNIKSKDYKKYVSGYGVGIDFTLRDLQSKAKQRGGPWAISKGFDCAAVFGEFVNAKKIKDPSELDLMLTLDDEVKQSGNTKDMIFSIGDVLEYVSSYMTVEEGDVFMTGTPHGVGPVNNDSVIYAEISNLPALEFTIIR